MKNYSREPSQLVQRILSLFLIISVYCSAPATSAERGNQWTSIGPTGVSDVTQVEFTSDPKIMYQVFNGGIQMSRDSGATWTDAASSIPFSSGYISTPYGMPFFLASNSGGLYSANAGATWLRLSYSLLLDYKAVALGSNNVRIYANNKVSGHAGQGDTIFGYSDDLGLTWRGAFDPVGVGTYTAPGSNRGWDVHLRDAARIAVVNSRDIYPNGDVVPQKATDRLSLHISADSFRTHQSQNLASGLPFAPAGLVKFHPVSTNSLYVSGIYNNFSKVNIWTTNNSGISWTKLGLELDNFYDPEGKGMPDDYPLIDIGIDPTSQFIYVLHPSGISSSRNGGVSWSHAIESSFSTSKKIERFGKYSTINLGKVSVNPQNGNHAIAALPSGCWETKNGGLNWIKFNNGQNSRKVPVRSIFVDRQGLRRIYAASSQGLRVTDDLGGHWTTLLGGDASSLIIPGSVTETIVVGFKNGGGKFSRDGGETWNECLGLPGNYAVHKMAGNPLEPLRMYAATENGPYRSVDGGSTWIPVFSGINFNDNLANQPRNCKSIACTPADTNVVYAVVGRYAYRSANKGDTWSVLPWTGSAKLTLNDIAVDPTKANNILVDSGDNGELLRSVNSGQTWSPVRIIESGQVISQSNASAIQFDPSGSGKVLVGSVYSNFLGAPDVLSDQGMLSLSKNFGESFSRIATGEFSPTLPLGAELGCLAFDPNDFDVMMVGTEGSFSNGALRFRSSSPVVLAVEPNEAQVESTVLVKGSDFAPRNILTRNPNPPYDTLTSFSITVKIGNVVITNSKYIDMNKILIQIPSSVAPGTYSITVENSDGSSGTLANAITVLPVSSNNRVPTISNIVWNPSTPTTNQAITFTSSVQEPDGDSLTYFWDFGNGSTSTTVSPSTTYSRPGSYRVKLSVSDGRGGVSVKFADVVVESVSSTVVSLISIDNNLVEGTSNSGLVRITRRGPVDSALTVSIAVTGTAMTGVDFVGISNSYTFPIGVSALDVPINPGPSDLNVEPIETIVVTILAGAYDISIDNSVVLYISDPGPSSDSIVATPTWSPPEGTYTTAQSVLVSTLTPGAVVRYTIDSTTPNSFSPVATGPLLVNSSMTLKARAFKAGLSDSPVSSAQYVIIQSNGPGDVNGDRVVNASDFAAVAAKFGLTSASPGWDPAVDTNGDGVINATDFANVAANFGKRY